MAVIKIDDSAYEQQLAEKAERITAQFAQFNAPELEVYDSATRHYRQRCEFRVWHDGDDLFHIMFDQQSKEKLRVDSFDPGAELVNEMMQVMIDKLKGNEVLRRKLFQIDYLTTLSGEVLISLLYHKQLDEAWHTAMLELRSELQQTYKVDFIGRARKQKVVFGHDYVTEKARG